MEKQTDFRPQLPFNKRGNYAKDLTIVKMVVQIICKQFRVSEIQLFGNRRLANTAKARHYAMYLIYNNTSFNYSEVAALFGRDHTTVLVVVRTINGYREVNDDYVKQLNYIQKNYFIN